MWLWTLVERACACFSPPPSSHGVSVKHDKESSLATETSSGSTDGGHIRRIQSVHDHYVVKSDVVGCGSSSTIHIGTSMLTGERVIVKFVRSGCRRQLLNELRAHEAIGHHAHIVKMLAIATCSTTSLSSCMDVGSAVFEYIHGSQDLLQYLMTKAHNKVSCSTACHILRQATSALGHIHESGICHRDIKLENILIVPRTKSVHVIDFGLSCPSHRGDARIIAGTPAYLPPEAHMAELLQNPLDCRPYDIWALGVLAFCLLFGRMPFPHGHTSIQQYIRFEKVLPTSLFNCILDLWTLADTHHICDELFAFMDRCLRLEPSDRPTAKDLISTFETVNHMGHGSQCLKAFAANDTCVPQHATKLFM